VVANDASPRRQPAPAASVLVRCSAIQQLDLGAIGSLLAANSLINPPAAKPAPRSDALMLFAVMPDTSGGRKAAQTGKSF